MNNPPGLIHFFKILIMKKSLLGAFIIASSALFAQDVPSSVSKAFQVKFPKAQETEWDMNDLDYVANFYEGDLSKSATFSEEGKHMETRTSLDEAPAVIAKAVKASFNSATVDAITLIETGAGNVSYEISASNDDASYSIVADKTGKILSSEEFVNNTDEGDYEEDEY